MTMNFVVVFFFCVSELALMFGGRTASSFFMAWLPTCVRTVTEAVMITSVMQHHNCYLPCYD